MRCPYCSFQVFQSTLPLRGATFLQLYVLPSTLFQSTLPLRGATCTKELCDEIVWQFQSTLPLRGATRYPIARVRGVNDISIHTPLAGSDRGHRRTGHGPVISIHTPLAGSDQQSLNSDARMDYFNPHSPCGERPTDSNLLLSNYQISIHTPLAGSDSRCRPCTKSTARYFNPHSPCGERHPRNATSSSRTANFNPHSPCGERLTPKKNLQMLMKFQSTLPLRGAT